MPSQKKRSPPPERVGQTSPTAVASRLGFLLKHAHVRYHAIQDPALAPLDLDGRLLAVLMLVGAEGPALQARLSERLQVDRTTMVALVDRLERAGLVRRHRDSSDRRGQQVRITTKGSRALERALDAIETVESEFLAPLSEQQQTQFRALLAKLALEP